MYSIVLSSSVAQQTNKKEGRGTDVFWVRVPKHPHHMDAAYIFDKDKQEM